METNNKNETYPALKTISIILKVIGYISLIVGLGAILVLIIFLSNDEYISDILAAIYVAIGNLLAALFVFAFAELILLFIKIEKNTRNLLLDQSSIRNLISMGTKGDDKLSDEFNNSYAEWKKSNSTKSLNDYYTYLRK